MKVDGSLELRTGHGGQLMLVRGEQAGTYGLYEVSLRPVGRFRRKWQAVKVAEQVLPGVDPAVVAEAWSEWVVES